MLRDCEKPFPPKILRNSFAWRANQACSTNLLKALNQSGFVASNVIN
jgi:hypothetical protein